MLVTDDLKTDEVLVNDRFMSNSGEKDMVRKRLEIMHVQGVPLKHLLSVHVFLAILGLSFLIFASLLGLTQPSFLAFKLDNILRVLQISGFGLIALSFLPLNVTSKVAMTGTLLMACGFVMV